MKGNRSVGQVSSPLRIPVSTLTRAHLSALEAFERWQRESPRSDAATTEERATDPDQPLLHSLTD
jgi:predicted MarR family transcription regulator